MPSSRLNILVYSGQGVSPAALKHTIHSLQQSLASKFDIKQVTAAELDGPWENTCATLVMPGGRDKDYLTALSDQMIARISEYVRNGGNYLGICAGAYFACSRIRFEEDRPGYEIVGKRPLNLFPGEAIGAVNPGFEYGGEKGAMTAAVQLFGMAASDCNFYLNGGCRFDFAGIDAKDWSIVGCYSKDQTPSIVRGFVGRGQVLLSGVHIEYSAALLDTDIPTLERLKLVSSESCRLSLWNELITSLLDIKVEPRDGIQDLPISRLVGDVDFGIGKENYAECFDTKEFLNRLNTNEVGRNILYTPRIGSTQTFLQENDAVAELLPNGTILLAGEQTKGRGRGANKWISPPLRSSLQFTFVVDHNDTSTLSLLQMVTAISIVQAVRKLRPGAPIHIKWPNDIYVRDGEDLKKVGGILVNSQIFGENCRALIGCGVNLGPCEQLTSINDIICGSKLYPEEVLAEFCNIFESLYANITENIQGVVDKYLELWLHTSQPVKIYDEDDYAVIIGIDRFGYLVAIKNGSEIIKLQPDGNSFDMLAGLIKLKTTP